LFHGCEEAFGAVRKESCRPSTAAEEEPVAERSGVHERKERGGKANEEAAPAVFSSEAVEALVNDYLHSRY
jgi:hypothetical protein